MISLVPNEYLHLVWDRAREHLLRFEKRAGGNCTVDDLGRRILNDEQQLWIMFDEDKEICGALVTQMWRYPRKKVMEIVACGGGDSKNQLDDYLYESMKVLEDFARTNDCDVMRVEGRKGWAKALKPYKFEQPAIVLEKEI